MPECEDKELELSGRLWQTCGQTCDPLLGVERPTVALERRDALVMKHATSRDTSKVQAVVHVSLWECLWKTSHHAEGPCADLNQRWL